MPGTAAFEIKLEERHPLVSLVTMIAPSPDWFTGVAGVRLLEDGAWVAEQTLVLEAWDAGTDGGATFTSPDADAMPQGRVERLAGAHFAAQGNIIPLCTATFRRLEPVGAGRVAF